MYKYRYIKKKELLDFIQSSFYKNCDNLPISSLRAISYINNPNTTNDDIVILLKLHKNKIIAYRNLFYEVIKKNNVSRKFAWISGSWVHPQYRRQGHSLDLLKKVAEVTDNIMFSNYAPESQNLYLKSKLFISVSELNGYKYFLKPSLKTTLLSKNKFFTKIKFLLKIADVILNKLIKIKDYFIKEINITAKINVLEENIQLPYNSFNRNESFFKYISNYPWITTKYDNKDISKKYFFSYYTTSFFVVFFEINKKNIFALKIRESKLTLLYLYAEPTYYKDITMFVLNYARKYNIVSILSYFPELNDYFNRKKAFFVFKKHQKTNFYASKELSHLFKKHNLQIQPGDGDNIFT